MQETLLRLFGDNPGLAVFISISISVIIAVLGIIPSVFITAANILFFGFVQGTIISFLGEAIGAGVAFILYRKGFKKMAENKLVKYPVLQKLINADNKKAFGLVFSLRLLPFVPSGFITFAAAIGRISFPVFLVASSLGKIPALLLEAWSVNEVTNFSWQGKIILAVIAIGFLYWIIKRLVFTPVKRENKE